MEQIELAHQEKLHEAATHACRLPNLAQREEANLHWCRVHVKGQEGQLGLEFLLCQKKRTQQKTTRRLHE